MAGMRADDHEHRLTAWWLDIAPSRQEELLSAEPPPMPWLDASLAEAGLDAEEVQRFLDAKRLEPTRDAGLHPGAG